MFGLIRTPKLSSPTSRASNPYRCQPVRCRLNCQSARLTIGTGTTSGSIGIEMGVLFGIYTLPTNNMVNYAMSIASIAFNLVWAGLYNMMYFRHLFNRGFKPATDRSKDLLTRAGYLPKSMR